MLTIDGCKTCFNLKKYVEFSQVEKESVYLERNDRYIQRKHTSSSLIGKCNIIPQMKKRGWESRMKKCPALVITVHMYYFVGHIACLLDDVFRLLGIN